MYCRKSKEAPEQPAPMMIDMLQTAIERNATGARMDTQWPSMPSCDPPVYPIWTEDEDAIPSLDGDDPALPDTPPLPEADLEDMRISIDVAEIWQLPEARANPTVSAQTIEPGVCLSRSQSDVTLAVKAEATPPPTVDDIPPPPGPPPPLDLEHVRMPIPPPPTVDDIPPPPGTPPPHDRADVGGWGEMGVGWQMAGQASALGYNGRGMTAAAGPAGAARGDNNSKPCANRIVVVVGAESDERADAPMEYGAGEPEGEAAWSEDIAAGDSSEENDAAPQLVSNWRPAAEHSCQSGVGIADETSVRVVFKIAMNNSAPPVIRKFSLQSADQVTVQQVWDRTASLFSLSHKSFQINVENGDQLFPLTQDYLTLVASEGMQSAVNLVVDVGPSAAPPFIAEGNEEPPTPVPDVAAEEEDDSGDLYDDTE